MKLLVVAIMVGLCSCAADRDRKFIYDPLTTWVAQADSPDASPVPSKSGCLSSKKHLAETAAGSAVIAGYFLLKDLGARTKVPEKAPVVLPTSGSSQVLLQELQSSAVQWCRALQQTKVEPAVVFLTVVSVLLCVHVSWEKFRVVRRQQKHAAGRLRGTWAAIALAWDTPFVDLPRPERATHARPLDTEEGSVPQLSARSSRSSRSSIERPPEKARLAETPKRPPRGGA